MAGGKVHAVLKVQPDVQLFLFQHPVGGFPQDVQQVGKAHQGVLAVLAQLGLNALGDAQIVLFHIVHIAGNVQRQLFHLGGNVQQAELFI